MTVKTYLLNSFGVNQDDGNPAGVVLNAEKLSDIQKKEIAAKIGFSETAFVEKSDKANFKVTFFTPTEEVDLCGHATIATYSLLLKLGQIKPGEFTQELKAGILKVSVEKDSKVIMDQSLPIFSDPVSPEEVASILGVSVNDISSTNLIPQILSTGLRDIIVPISSREILNKIVPNLKAMSSLNKKTDTIGFHIFTFDVVNSKATANSRNFAPLYGINEESATGSSTGALACYIYKYGRLKGNLENLVFEQGYSMNKPSEIIVSLNVDTGKITRVRVGGKASLFEEKNLVI